MKATKNARKNGYAARKIAAAIGLFYEGVADTGRCANPRTTSNFTVCCTLPSADLEFALGDAVDTLVKQRNFSDNVGEVLVNFAYGNRELEQQEGTF